MAWAEPQPGGGFRGRYRVPGNPKQKETVLQPDGTAWPTAKKARDAANTAEVESKRKAPPKKGASKIPASTTWGAWWDILLTKRVFEVTDTGSVEAAIVRKHIRPLWGEVPLNMIVTKHPEGDAQRGLQEWVDTELKVRPGMSAAYARRVFSVMRVSLNIAADEEILDASPAVRVKLPRVPRRKKPHTSPVKIKAMNIRDDYKDILTFGTETGLRPGELSGLHVSECDLERETVTVSCVLVLGKKIIRHFPKDDDHRTVPLTELALEILKRQLVNRDLKAKCPLGHVGGNCTGALLFMTKRGKPFNSQSAWLTMNRPDGNNQRPHVGGMYSTRHGFGTRVADGGMNPFLLAELMGHSDISMTQRYYQASKKVKRQLREALCDE